jgi:methionyl aminopeptidase
MISIKSDSELKKMRKGGRILTDVMKRLMIEAVEGVSLKALDRIAEKEIIKQGGKPSFKMVKDYKWTICACVNDIVVHGIPNEYILKNGDIIGIDCGVYFEGFHTDSSWTIKIGDEKKDNKETKHFLEIGEQALYLALKKVKEGNYVYDISQAIENCISNSGYHIVKSLVGHGIGRQLHEEPEIPGFVNNARDKTPLLKKGMTLAIEVIYNMATPDIIYKDDGWTIASKDGKISGLFEATVEVTSHGCLVLTPLVPGLEKAI